MTAVPLDQVRQPSLAALCDRFLGLEVTVLGDAVLDVYLGGTASRLSREAPVPVVSVTGRAQVPGGAANVAANLRALGASVRLVSVVGDDPAGQALCASLSGCGVDTDGILLHPRRRTLVFHRISAAGQQLVRFDEGDTDPVDQASAAWLAKRLSAGMEASQAVVISDYGYGAIPSTLVAELIQLQGHHPRLLALDARHPEVYRQVGVTVVKPNWDEAMELLGSSWPRIEAGDVPSAAVVARPAGGSVPTAPARLPAPSARAEALAAHSGPLLERTGAQVVAVTLDTEGAVVLERDRPAHRTYARAIGLARATGAGDTFLSAFTLALAAGADTPAAAELASLAASVVVVREGTAVCSAEDLRRHLSAEDKQAPGLDVLADRVRAYRRAGRRVVFTNGCFDLIHRGHIALLNQAKALGDVLVVGVNDDEGVRLLKGPGRPINSLGDRIDVLAALSCVDDIVAFPGEVADEVLRRIQPDVYAKGGDYTLDTLPEAPIVAAMGGVVEILPYVGDRSTASIVERIRSHSLPARAGAPAP